MKQVSYLLVTAATVFGLSALPAYAQTATPIPTATPTPTCQAVYGGGANCNVTGSLLIDKTVKNPQNNQFSNNLLQDTYVFGTSEDITFHLTLTNTTSGDINNINIIDTLPANLDYVSGDGTFNGQNREVTVKEAKLISKTKATFTLITKVNSQPLPGTQPVVCLSNTAQAQTTSFFFFNHTQAQDTAIFCIKASAGPTPTPIIGTSPTNPTQPSANTNQTPGGKPVYGAPSTSQTPPTGPDTAALVMLPLLLGIGKFLQRKAGSA